MSKLCNARAFSKKKWLIGKLASGLLLFSASLILPGCIEEPVSPVWDLQLNAPVTNKSYTLMDVIEKDEEGAIQYNTSNQNLYYSDDKPVSTISVGDKLKLNPSVSNVQFNIQKLTINPAAFSTSVAISQLLSGITQPTPVAVPIPYVKQTVNQNLATIPDFEEMVLESGTITLTISNNTTDKCSIRVHGVTIANISDNNAIFSKTDSTLVPPGQSITINQSLAGKTMKNQLKASITISTVPGSSKITPTETIGFQFAMSNLVPSRMRAKIPAQEPFSNSSTFQLDETSRIKIVSVKKGKLVYTLKNNFNASVNASFSIPELRTNTGAAYASAYTLAAGETKPVTIPDLSGWALQSTDGSYTRNITFNVTTSVLATNTAVEIAKTDNVGITVNMDTLTLKRVDGILKPTSLATTKTSLPISLGSLKNFNATEIRFNGFLLDLNLGMSANTKIRLENASVIGKNSLRTQTINIPTTTLNGNNSIQKINISQTQLNDFLNAFINKPPDSLFISYGATVNPAGEAIIINDADTVYGTSAIEIPLNVEVRGGTIVDTTDIEIPESNKDKLDNVLSGKIRLKIENGIPAEVIFTGKLLDANGNFLMNLPPNTPSNITVKAATVNAAGVVSKATISEIDISLNNSEIKKFIDSKKMIVSLQFSTSGTETVVFRTTDYIKVYAAGQLNYRNKP